MARPIGVDESEVAPEDRQKAPIYKSQLLHWADLGNKGELLDGYAKSVTYDINMTCAVADFVFLATGCHNGGGTFE
jgi:hypothetical protein